MAQTNTQKTKAKKAKPKKKTVPVKERRAQEAAKKARQRAAKRARGLKEISVWVLPEHAQAVRDFSDSLPQPPMGATGDEAESVHESPPSMKFFDEVKGGPSDVQTGPEY